MDNSVDNLANLRVASFSYYLKSNESLVQKLNCPDQNPSPDDETALSLTKSSPYTINFSKSIDCSENVKVKKLSAFLNDPQESIMFKVKRTSLDVRSQTGQQTGPRTNERIKQSMDGEIDIFSADKYFNMKLECVVPAAPPVAAKMIKMSETKRDDRTVDFDLYVKKQEAPSVCSEASTWSSGGALLHNLPRNNSQKKARKFTGRRFFSTIGCTGPCFDKESVYVNQSRSLKTGDNFTFPLVDHVVKPENHQKHIFNKFEDKKIEDDFRKSIEVYGGSDTMKKDDITKNLERRLCMLTWDAIPKSTIISGIPTSVVTTTTTACDDMASDVSSDLFEIENISATCGGGYMMSRESVEDVPGCMTPTTQYAPSEASFEWSVVTASAADFSSAVSEYDLKQVGVSGNEGPVKVKNSIPRNKEAPKSRSGGGGILGCKSLKSLSVAETIHKTKVERY